MSRRLTLSSISSSNMTCSPQVYSHNIEPWQKQSLDLICTELLFPSPQTIRALNKTQSSACWTPRQMCYPVPCRLVCVLWGEWRWRTKPQVNSSSSLLTPAQEGGHFTAEIAPVPIKTKKGPTEMSVDEHPKPQTTAEGLAKLPPVFKKDGTVTAGTASVGGGRRLSWGWGRIAGQRD